MRKFLFLLFISAGLIGCGAKNLSIDMAVKSGFEKDQIKYFQMVGALDGWGGKWAGETVEIYEFKDAESVQSDFFNNTSGWSEVCVRENLLMLSKGKSACRALEKL